MPQGHPCSTAHPRSRGEHLMRSALSCVIGGSSPLARGTRCPAWGWDVAYRLIPARAGNTINQARSGFRFAAHPRSRGEHMSLPSARRAACGSSPLARGTPVLAPFRACLGRLIPARAGNTNGRLRKYLAKTAHPRSRGEHVCVGQVCYYY